MYFATEFYPNTFLSASIRSTTSSIVHGKGSSSAAIAGVVLMPYFANSAPCGRQKFDWSEDALFGNGHTHETQHGGFMIVLGKRHDGRGEQLVVW